MEMRSRLLSTLNNKEVEEYLDRNDIIIVPVGTVEMHGGLPLDCETVVSEGIAVKMAETVDGLVLPHLPYFYAGATATGRGTTQVSVRQGIDYLGAIARSLLRQGFKRQIYISMHGPAHMTCSPMVRDFFDETGVPILYMDMTQHMMGSAQHLMSAAELHPEGAAGFMKMFDSMILGGYDIMGRLDDVPLVTEFYHEDPQSVAQFQVLFDQAYQSGSMGYCFGKETDHMSTTKIETPEIRQQMADDGKKMIDALVADMDLPTIVQKLAEMHEFEDKLAEERPWIRANAYLDR